MAQAKHSIPLLLVAACVLVIVQPKKNDFWSYFVFTQQWPQAACIYGNSTGHNCQIPNNVTTWTIHGLWPSDPNSHEGPAFCNSSWKFQERLILSLEDKMKKYWPNLYVGEPTTDFWAHEWDKHGTCSTDLPMTENEFDYFSQTLLLNEYYNFTRIFMKNGLTPGNGYTLADIENVLKATLGHTPNIQCAMNKTAGQPEVQFIYQIEMCLAKNFTVIDCPHAKTLFFQSGRNPQDFSKIETGMCSTKKPVQYLTILH